MRSVTIATSAEASITAYRSGCSRARARYVSRTRWKNSTSSRSNLSADPPASTGFDPRVGGGRRSHPAPRGACQTDLDREVQHEHQIGAEVALYSLLKSRDPRRIDIAPASLVGERRIGEPFAQNPDAILDRRGDHLGKMLGPRREHDEKLRHR